MKNPVIHCTQPVRGTLYFFITANGEMHYLFGQNFRDSLWKRYRFGIRLDEALDRSKWSHVDQKICDKLFKVLPHVEREYSISLLRKKPKSSRHERRKDDEIAA